jgi:hypothetical protein
MKLLTTALLTGSALAITVVPHASYDASHYHSLSQTAKSIDSSVCFAHGNGALDRLLDNPKKACSHIVVYGGSPARSTDVPVLVISGSLDGIFPMSQFAVNRHKAQNIDNYNNVRFALIHGAAHHSVLDYDAEKHHDLLALDLLPEKSNGDVHSMVENLVNDFITGGNNGVLASAELHASQAAEPIVKSLEMEGSAALGVPFCNSDFPTNPSCNYPKYPDHSLNPLPVRKAHS